MTIKGKKNTKLLIINAYRSYDDNCNTRLSNVITQQWDILEEQDLEGKKNFNIYFKSLLFVSLESDTEVD